jgi:hypothetical protein
LINNIDTMTLQKKNVHRDVTTLWMQRAGVASERERIGREIRVEKGRPYALINVEAGVLSREEV